VGPQNKNRQVDKCAARAPLLGADREMPPIDDLFGVRDVQPRKLIVLSGRRHMNATRE
jgi:hypothetical protein